MFILKLENPFQRHPGKETTCLADLSCIYSRCLCRAPTNRIMSNALHILSFLACDGLWRRAWRWTNAVTSVARSLERFRALHPSS